MLFRIADLFPKYCLSHGVIVEKREVWVEVRFSRGGPCGGEEENPEATAGSLLAFA